MDDYSIRINGAGGDNAPAPSVSDAAPALDHASAVYGAVLRFVEARSLYLVGMALAMKFPVEDDFMAFLETPDFIDAIESFASVRQDILLEGQLNASPGAREAAVTAHMTRARESLEVLAELLELPPEDIVSVLVR